METNKIAELTKLVKIAESALLGCKKGESEQCLQNLIEAKQALLKYEESLISPEHRKLRKEHEKLVGQMEELKNKLAASTLEMHNAGLLKGAGGQKGKLTYEMAQEIRKALSEMQKGSIIREKYGISSSSINYIENYRHYKLREGDTAYTPLVNAYYPLGAPYEGQGVDRDEFRVKGWVVGDVLKQIQNTEKSDEEIANEFMVPVFKITELRNRK